MFIQYKIGSSFIIQNTNFEVKRQTKHSVSVDEDLKSGIAAYFTN